MKKSPSIEYSWMRRLQNGALCSALKCRRYARRALDCSPSSLQALAVPGQCQASAVIVVRALPYNLSRYEPNNMLHYMH